MNPLARYRNRNNRLFFYLRGILNLLLPSGGYTRKLLERYRAMSPEERACVHRRVDYYVKLTKPFPVKENGTSIRDFRRSRKHQHSNYFFDLYESLRHFAEHLKFHYRVGDNFSVPPVPTLVKARTLTGDNANSVLMKLNKVRHFNFVTDHVAFEDKCDRLVWRGNARRPHRQKVVQQLYSHPLCDIGQTNPSPEAVPWHKPYLSIDEQLRYKFVLSIEGNDVATNLKWIMSSRSVCFMTRPTRETWFMEGDLIPDHHYVHLQSDYGDLEEKAHYYIAHPQRAREIVRNAHDHVAQFIDDDREAIIALCVLDRYFSLSGQSPTLGFHTSAVSTPTL